MSDRSCDNPLRADCNLFNHLTARLKWSSTHDVLQASRERVSPELVSIAVLAQWLSVSVLIRLRAAERSQAWSLMTETRLGQIEDPLLLPLQSNYLAPLLYFSILFSFYGPV